ncbi:MAG: PKD domain-containing protein [Bacteroidota bacterium]
MPIDLATLQDAWMKKLYLFLLILAFSQFPQTGFATHIVGGEINYRCLGNDQYEISLQIFRDCFTGQPWFDNPASIGIFNANDSLIFDLRVFPMGNDTLDPQLSNPCLVIPPQVCYHTTMYRDTVELPFIQGGYQVAYQRCCRNQSILNIVNPLMTGATYYSFISEQALLECNNSAFFNDWPPFFICADFPIDFEHFAIDIDGDSIVYQMCAPFTGASFNFPIPQPPNNPPYDSVTWVNPPYNTNNMLNGVPLDIDPVTGFLTGVPNTVGQFVVGICAQEYRNGQLISTTRRDFQFNVGICGLKVVSSFFAPEVQCGDQLSIFFDNQSEGSEAFFWDFGDNNTSNDPSPTHVYADTGNYIVTLIAGPGAACTDTFTQTINVQYQSLFVDFSLEYETCEEQIIIDYIDLSVDTLSEIVSWDWDFGNNTGSIDQFPSIEYDDPGSYLVTLEVTAANGCIGSASATVEFSIPQISLQDTLLLCPGEPPIELNPDGDPELLYEWVPHEGLDDPFSANPSASPSETTIYTVFGSIFNNFDTCSVEQSVTVFVPPAVSVSANPDTTICDPMLILNAVSQNGNGIYFWSDEPDFSNTINVSGAPDVEVVIDGTEDFFVRVFDEYGCSDEDTVVVTYSTVDIDTEGLIQVCVNDTMRLEVLNLDPNDQLAYSWSPADDIVEGENTATPLIMPTTSQELTVTAINQHGCSAMLTVFVDVSSLTPPVQAWVDRDSIFPGETVQLFSTEDNGYSYNWSPQMFVDNAAIANPVAKPDVTTTFVVEIEDEFGCTNKDSVTVFLKDFICGEPFIFVPNAFTPNGDGVNDILYVRANAVTDVYFVIYSRWGEKIFETNDKDIGWDGTFKGAELSPDVFGYYLTLRCLNEELYSRKGNITLLR